VGQQLSRRSLLQVPCRYGLDIGANEGTWIRTVIQFLLERQCTLIEPQDKGGIELKSWISLAGAVEASTKAGAMINRRK
jgi:hypothetical protein